MKRTAPTAFLLALLALLPLTRAADTPPDADAKNMADDFQWFTSLGWPDVKGLKPVRFIFSYSESVEGRKPVWLSGFLQKDSPDEFRVLMLNFDTVKVPKKGYPAPNTTLPLHYEPLDLAAAAEARLDTIKTNPNFHQKLDYTKFPPFEMFLGGPKYSESAGLFVLAWACSRQGLDAQAVALYKAAQTAPGIYSSNTPDGWPFRYKLDHDLGQFDLWRVMLDFSDDKIPRAELAKHLRQLATEFPHCDYIARVNTTADTLEKMVAEDKAHTSLTDAQIAKLSPEEQAKEWIFRLRDQPGFQFSQPGWVQIFGLSNDDGSGYRTDTPAEKLAALGDAAVPQLIDALGDKRYTRAVGYGRDFTFSHEVMTIGDASIKIIEKIAGYEFYRSGIIQGTMAQDNETDEVRASVQAWWKKRQQIGEQADLAEFVATGHPFSGEAASRLAEKYPDSPVTAHALLAGAQAAKDVEVRDVLIHLYSHTKDDGVKPFLLKELKDDPDLKPRVQAGYDLLRLGDTSALPDLADAWQNTDAKTSAQSFRNPREAIIYILTHADSPIGFNALAKDLSTRSPRARSAILSAVTTTPSWQLQGLSELSFEKADWKSENTLNLSAPARDALQALLASELDDTSNFTGGGGMMRNVNVTRARICDIAAFILAQRWPDQFQFDESAGYLARNRQLTIMLNTWRKTQKLDPLPLPPEPPAAKPDDADKIVAISTEHDFKLPAALQKIVDASKGRKPNGAFLRELAAALQDSVKAGDLPAAPFAIEAMRGADNSGYTLIIKPADLIPRAQSDQHAPPPPWRASCSLSLHGIESNNDLDTTAPMLDAADPAKTVGWADIELTFAPEGAAPYDPL